MNRREAGSNVVVPGTWISSCRRGNSAVHPGHLKHHRELPGLCRYTEESRHEVGRGT